MKSSGQVVKPHGAGPLRREEKALGGSPGALPHAQDLPELSFLASKWGLYLERPADRVLGTWHFAGTDSFGAELLMALC